MDAVSIISGWKKGQFSPFYWLEGEDDYFIDQVVDAAENSLLSPSEASFNLTVMYGRESNWSEVLTNCRRYPMFSERQVVIIKEAQYMRDIEKLEPYFENPLASTVLVIAHKEKKLDNRKKFAKTIKEKGVYVSFKKQTEREIAEWTESKFKEAGLRITDRALILFTDHLGSDRSRIEKEIEKLALNKNEGQEITEDVIEKYVGVSKEHNVFELQAALAQRDFLKAYRIIQYFKENAKAAPVQLILPLLYAFFSKAIMIFGTDQRDERTLASILGVPPFSIKNYLTAAKIYGYPGLERNLLLLYQYNLKSVGVGSSADDAALLKELILKMTLVQR
ncbi:MAG: polymerase subunit delta [Bacteroidota bacterium]|jgi:DNA polymerase-3 subunit delta